MKNVWKNIEKIVLVSSIPLSFIALIISIKSCSDSNEALEISKKEFESQRLLVLQSNPSNMLPGFEFSSFDSNQKLQRLIIELPKNIYKEKIFVEPPDFHFSLTEIQDNLEVHIHKSLSEDAKKNSLYIKSTQVPIIIKTNFIFAGESLWDTSVYNLEFSYQQDYLNNMGSNVDFKSLIFENRLSNDDYEEMKDKLAIICETNLRNSIKNY